MGAGVVVGETQVELESVCADPVDRESCTPAGVREALYLVPREPAHAEHAAPVGGAHRVPERLWIGRDVVV